ncbi:hypothetical protein [Novipirellula artificiosorum]|uniref:Uncharacterized protein n=1 Tax=Novipirellula artificiosorum TaxID=2528016 RepID=A0A5C6DGR5_9BACT|nr:hypothetical protein [Novipirellula artificiosorum]TWU34921.1 hypothetical protein Poly41_40640 [Novipirellula artificiosorum]
MDPQATWNELIRAWSARDVQAAQEAAEALLEWLRKGGFAPLTMQQLPQGDLLHETIATAVCNAVRLHTSLDFPNEESNNDNDNQVGDQGSPST